MYPRVFNRSLNGGGVSIRGYSYHYLQLPYNFKVINKVLYFFVHIVHKVGFSLLNPWAKSTSARTHNSTTFAPTITPHN